MFFSVIQFYFNFNTFLLEFEIETVEDDLECMREVRLNSASTAERERLQTADSQTVCYNPVGNSLLVMSVPVLCGLTSCYLGWSGEAGRGHCLLAGCCTALAGWRLGLLGGLAGILAGWASPLGRIFL